MKKVMNTIIKKINKKNACYIALIAALIAILATGQKILSVFDVISDDPSADIYSIGCSYLIAVWVALNTIFTSLFTTINNRKIDDQQRVNLLPFINLQDDILNFDEKKVT